MITAPTGTLSRSDLPAGFEANEIANAGLWLIAEDEKTRRGAGGFVIRTKAATALIVEAPHTFFDQETLPIAVAIFTTQRAAALFINTAHRYEGRTKPDGEETAANPPSDVAHAEHSFFLAAHRASLDAFPRITTVQLHGFQDSSVPDVSLIVSAAGSTAELNGLVQSLRAALTDHTVSVYPTETQKLGGESNQQAHVSVLSGAPFYHIEMSRSLRDKLIDDAALLASFAKAFSPICVPLIRTNR